MSDDERFSSEPFINGQLAGLRFAYEVVRAFPGTTTGYIKDRIQTKISELLEGIDA